MKEVKHRLISEGYMKEECSRCRFHEKRITDEKVPLIINYVDGNKRNWKLENLEFLCYNCYFLNIGDVFQQKQLDALEDYKVIQAKPADFEIPAIHKEEVNKIMGFTNKNFDKKEDIDRPVDFGDDLIVGKRGR